MALVRASKKCFTAFEAALEAVERNDANGAVIVLQSVRSEAKILQKEAHIFHEQLINVEQEDETKVENLTRQMNQLYENEQQLKKKEEKLEVKMSGLRATREQHKENRNVAERRREAARAEQRKAEEKHDELRSYWWVPIYGQVLLVRELIEDNKEQARQAERKKNRYAREVENSDSDISSTNAKINQVHQEIGKIQNYINRLNEERAKSYSELGEYKTMTTVVLDVLSFSEVLINMIGEASLKTDYLQRIMAIVDKRKTSIGRSGGMKTAVNSFENSWINIIDMMDSNRIAILNDRRLVGIYEARYANTHIFDILIVFVSVLMVLFFCFVFPK